MSIVIYTGFKPNVKNVDMNLLDAILAKTLLGEVLNAILAIQHIRLTDNINVTVNSVIIMSIQQHAKNMMTSTNVLDGMVIKNVLNAKKVKII